MKKRGEAEEWIDCFIRYHLIEIYRKRMEELELVQKKLLKAFIDETEKTGWQNKSLIYQLAKLYQGIPKSWLILV